MKLQDLIFSDLFVGQTLEASWLKATPDSLITTPVPHECKDEILRFRQELEARTDTVSDFEINLPGDGKQRLRVKRMLVSAGLIFVCRAYRIAGGELSDLGMNQAVIRELMSPDLRSGLVVVVGRPGSGKTTAATTFLRQKVAQEGGVAFTIESPIEIVMEGRHGAGIIYQTKVHDDSEIGPKVKDLFRATPNYLFIGEVFGAAAVKEAINAALGGMLVCMTYHGHSLLGALSRLHRLGGGTSADMGLADVLRAAIHLELHNKAPTESMASAKGLLTGPVNEGTGSPPRVLSVRPLFVGEEDYGLRSLIRAGDFEQLSSEVTKQRNQFLAGTRALPRSL